MTLVLGGLLAGCLAQPSIALHGTVLDPPKSAPAFVLTDQAGRAFDSRRLKDRPTALFFGFTRCKDTCPQTLALLGKAAKQSNLPEAALRIVMISVDPRGDSPAAMRAFIAGVGVRGATGLTGSAAVLEPVWRAFGVGVHPVPGDLVHSDFIYILDRGGHVRELVHPDAKITDLASDLRTISVH